MQEVINSIEALCKKITLPVREIVRLKGDGSDRQIFRVYSDIKTAIAVYGDNLAENRAFIEFRRSFADAEIRVPALFAQNSDCSCYLLEDLGDTTLKDKADKLFLQQDFTALEKIYCQALQILPQIQLEVDKKIDYSYCYQSPVFDQENMLFDANRFGVYFLKQLCKIEDISEFSTKIKTLTADLAHNSNYFLYRDFQTRNIMIKNGELCFIDFQSGRKGPLQYDLASFVYSSGTHLPEGMEDKLINCYLESLSQFQTNSRDEFLHNFYGFGIIRVIQALGGYAYLGLIKNKTDFLAKIPIGLKQLDRLQKLCGAELISIQTIKDKF